MKYFSLVLLLGTIISVTSCASPKFKSFRSYDDFVSTSNKMMGKTPKEVVAIIGKPMRSFFNDGVDDKYSIVYPVGEGDLSMVDVMFNADLKCNSMTFEKDQGYKYAGWRTSAPDSSCRGSKDEKMNTTLID